MITVSWLATRSGVVTAWSRNCSERHSERLARRTANFTVIVLRD
jgi:hypothetical protein